MRYVSKIYECSPVPKEAKKDFSQYPAREKLTKREIRQQNKSIQKKASLIMKSQGLSGQLVKVAKAKELVEKWVRDGNLLPSIGIAKNTLHKTKIAQRKTGRESRVLFYESDAWRSLRYKALKFYGRKCCVCGATPPDVVLHVDHIKPRSLYPELELCLENLQILCKDCNLGKSNTDSIDWR